MAKGMKIKKGDTVKVIAGKDKGAGRAGNTGGIITTEAPIHVSNVMLVEGKGVTRVGFRRDEVLKKRPDGSQYAGFRSVRVSRKTGKDI